MRQENEDRKYKSYNFSPNSGELAPPNIQGCPRFNLVVGRKGLDSTTHSYL
jgi:hypothetical protein